MTNFVGFSDGPSADECVRDCYYRWLPLYERWLAVWLREVFDKGAAAAEVGDTDQQNSAGDSDQRFNERFAAITQGMLERFLGSNWPYLLDRDQNEPPAFRDYPGYLVADIHDSMPALIEVLCWSNCEHHEEFLRFFDFLFSWDFNDPNTVYHVLIVPVWRRLARMQLPAAPPIPAPKQYADGEVGLRLGDAIVELDRLRAWLESLPDEIRFPFPELLSAAERKAPPESASERNADPDLPAGPKVRRSCGINARMLETIQSNPDAMGWSCPRWATHLKCAKSSVVATETWKDLSMRRDRERAQRRRDRQRR
jgi:hypothetical protein